MLFAHFQECLAGMRREREERERQGRRRGGSNRRSYAFIDVDISSSDDEGMVLLATIQWDFTTFTRLRIPRPAASSGMRQLRAKVKSP